MNSTEISLNPLRPYASRRYLFGCALIAISAMTVLAIFAICLKDYFLKDENLRNKLELIVDKVLGAVRLPLVFIPLWFVIVLAYFTAPRTTPELIKQRNIFIGIIFSLIFYSWMKLVSYPLAVFLIRKVLHVHL